MTRVEIIEQVSKDTGIPKEVVNLANNSFWRFIRRTIKELPLKEVQTKEELSALRTSFNIPSLGKLYVPYQQIYGLRRHYEYMQKHYNLNAKT